MLRQNKCLSTVMEHVEHEQRHILAVQRRVTVYIVGLTKVSYFIPTNVQTHF